MTDNGIMQALECCAKDEVVHFCYSCPLLDIENNNCQKRLARGCRDLINRQKAEIERLEKELMKCKLEKEMLYNLGTEIKTVAIKEFADRLKENITSAIDTYYNSNGGGYYLAEDTIEDIDNLVKEMTEVSE